MMMPGHIGEMSEPDVDTIYEDEDGSQPVHVRALNAPRGTIPRYSGDSSRRTPAPQAQNEDSDEEPPPLPPQGPRSGGGLKKSIGFKSTPDDITAFDPPALDAREEPENAYEEFTSASALFRIDGAEQGHLYKEITDEIDPEIPLLEDWPQNQPRFAARNRCQLAAEYLFRVLTFMLYPVAVLVNEFVRCLGYCTYYFIVRPLHSLTELVVKPILDSVFYLLSPVSTFIQALLLPLAALYEGLLRGITTCCSTIAASCPCGSSRRQHQSDEEEAGL